MRRILRRVDGGALDAAIGAWLAARDPDRPPPDHDLGRRDRRSLAVDGKTVRRARRTDGTQVHLLTAMTGTGLAAKSAANSSRQCTDMRRLGIVSAAAGRGSIRNRRRAQAAAPRPCHAARSASVTGARGRPAAGRAEQSADSPDLRPDSPHPQVEGLVGREEIDFDSRDCLRDGWCAAMARCPSTSGRLRREPGSLRRRCDVSTLEPGEVPRHLATSYATGFGEEGRAWIAGLPALAATMLERWDLERDGTARAGEASLVLPVLRPDGTPAVLRLQMPRQETTAALIGLRTWNGKGTVRLLDHDLMSSTMLLERLNGARTLASINNDDVAMSTLAELHARLVAVPAPRGLRSLGDIASDMLDQIPQALTRLADPADRQLLRSWASAVAELAGEPGDRMLHWDLHYGNVLAARREPWIAVDPEPLAGDPGFDLWPALDSRWDDVVANGDTLRIVRRRFDLLTDVLGLDRACATGWTLGRLLQNSLWDIDDGETRLAPSSVAIADSLLSR